MKKLFSIKWLIGISAILFFVSKKKKDKAQETLEKSTFEANNISQKKPTENILVKKAQDLKSIEQEIEHQQVHVKTKPRYSNSSTIKSSSRSFIVDEKLPKPDITTKSKPHIIINPKNWVKKPIFKDSSIKYPIRKNCS